MKLRRVTLLADDFPALEEFYHWLPVLPSEEGELCLEVGRTVLEFRASPGATGGVHFAIDVPVSRFGEIAGWAEKELGLISDSSGQTHFRFESWRANACYFLDPAGNIGEFIAREERSHPESSRFVSLSEIGLVVPDVTDARRSLARLGIEPYGQPDDDFAAMGDPDGLFIVVSEGRGWYPNGIPARALPMLVEFEVTAANSRRYQRGDSLGVSVENPDGQQRVLTGMVYTVDTIADINTRTFTVSLHVRNQPETAICDSGSSEVIATTNIMFPLNLGPIVTGDERLLVEKTAIHRIGDEDFVWKITNRSWDVLSHAEHRELTVQRMKVRITSDVIPFLGTWNFVAIEFEDPTTVDLAQDMITGMLTFKNDNAEDLSLIHI